MTPPLAPDPAAVAPVVPASLSSLSPVELRELWSQVGDHARGDAERRARGCARPVRLRGSTTVLDEVTGQVRSTYSSAGELDGATYVRCRNRRASVCPSCSHEYKGDAWHLLMCGLAGGKGVPVEVATHPTVFATLTAPSFGPVHGRRGDKPCRARRDKPLCEHGRPVWCLTRHREDDDRLGQPLCPRCYDYPAHVLWQWHAPELWRRFTIALTRALAAHVGLSVTGFRRQARVSYTKVVEFQARGAIHAHALVRLDGPTGADTATALPVGVAELEDAVRIAAGHIAYAAPDVAGNGVVLRWGSQVDVRRIAADADRDASVGDAHAEQIAAYLSKYLTKTTDEFGLPARVHSAAHAAHAGATPHAVALVVATEDLATALANDDDEDTAAEGRRLLGCLGTLGYRGHPVTKSRTYSTTFGALREARRVWKRRPAALDPDAAVRELPADDDPVADCAVTVIKAWEFVGLGYLDSDAAEAAARSAMLARSRRS